MWHTVYCDSGYNGTAILNVTHRVLWFRYQGTASLNVTHCVLLMQIPVLVPTTCDIPAIQIPNSLRTYINPDSLCLTNTTMFFKAQNTLHYWGRVSFYNAWINQPDLVEHTELDWAESGLHSSGKVGKPTCSHMVLSESVGTTHGSSTSQTSRPYGNARLYEHRQHIIC